MGLILRASLLEPSYEKLTCSFFTSKNTREHMVPNSLGYESLWKCNAHRWVHTDIQTHRHTHTENHTLCKYISPQRNGSHFLRHSLQIDKLLWKRFWGQGLAWGVLWISWRGTLKMSHLPWKMELEGQSGQLSSCACHWDECTAP